MTGDPDDVPRGVIRRWWWRRGVLGRPWTAIPHAVIDFEATSADPRSAAALSVGWVRIVDGRIRLADAGYTLVRHAGAVPTPGVGVHGLGPDLVAGAPSAEEVAQRLTAVLDGAVLVAHGARLELALLRRLGVARPDLGVLDTMRLLPAADRSLGRGAGRRRGMLQLSAAARRHGVPVHRPHHAFGDALTTAGLYLALAHRLSGARPASVRDLRRIARARSW